jgi:hypothetical protein
MGLILCVNSPKLIEWEALVTPTSSARARPTLSNNHAMNTDEATTAVRHVLTKYRVRPYVELCRLVGTRLPTLTVTADSGTEYQVAIQVQWDGKPGGDIRVIGLVDDTAWRAFVPLSQDFITSADGGVAATW